MHKTRYSVVAECGRNLHQLKKAIQLYTEQCDGLYPTPDKWCALLLEGNYLKSEKYFKCPATKVGRCHFAINPNCSPNSPNDVVLLFETEGGWNQYGGPELLTMNNHKGKGANILFNNGWIMFVNPKEVEVDTLRWPKKVEVNQLKWKPDEAQDE